MKAFESAFDPQWREDYRNLYRLAGMDLALEDVGHFHEPSFRAGLQHTARAGFVYDKIKADARRVSGMDDLDAARRDKKVAVLLHLHGANWFAMTPDPLQTLDLFFALGVRVSQLTFPATYVASHICCGKPHGGFGERGEETWPWWRLRHRHDGESRRQQRLPPTYRRRASPRLYTKGRAPSAVGPGETLGKFA